MSDVVVGLLSESRRREYEQTLVYRGLSVMAEVSGDAATAERLNELLADEQHHVSRLTARLLELGEIPEPFGEAPPDVPDLSDWEPVARRREEDEVAWYEAAVARLDHDPHTRMIFREILASERHHAESLGGKWMPAGPPSEPAVGGASPSPSHEVEDPA